MKTAITTFVQLLKQAPGKSVGWLFALLLASSLTEGLGILMLLPMLELLGDGTGQHQSVARMLHGFEAFGIPTGTTGLLSVFVLLIALRSIIQMMADRSSARVQYQLVDRLRHKCFAALLNVEWRWLLGWRRSDHGNLLLRDINRIGVGLTFGIGLATTLMKMVAYLGVALLLSPQMTLLVVISGGAVFALLSRQRRQAFDLGARQSKASRALHGNVEESLSGIKLSKILGNEHRHLDLFDTTIDDLRRQQLAFVDHTSLTRALFQSGGGLLLALFVAAGLSLWRISASELLTLVLIFGRLLPMFMAGQQQLHYWVHAMPAVRETEHLLAETGRHAEQHVAVATGVWPVVHDIRLEGVCLCYPGRDTAALDDVTLRIPANCTTAIMGPSGSGKSSLADILMGLLTPDQGRISIDDTAMVGAARKAWRGSVAYVPQDVFLFHDTIYRNLLWGNANASDDDLADALRRAAADFVFVLPDGLDTIVGDGGVRLSGGERQRLALARALLKRPSLLILDEATSALDMVNEMRILTAIKQLRGDLTVVIIGHRLPILEHADQVVILEDGRIAAQGSWFDVRTQLEQRP